MIEKDIRRLVEYAKIHLGLDEEDATYNENLILREFALASNYEGDVEKDDLADLIVPDTLLAPLNDYLVKELHFDEGEAERKLTYVMGLLSPLPSIVNKEFNSLAKINPEDATEYLYRLSVANNYVAKTKVDRNILWDASFEKGSPLEISINLSKPEKNNKDIAKLVHSVSSSYPKCLLCHENLGFAGNQKHPARENIRFIPLLLDKERWYIQFSPYGYFKRHCILFYEKHENMEMSRRIFSCLFSFVDQFPHYFIGSNSDLPIVGGSILNHEHFQGGEHLLPLLKAKMKEEVPVKLKSTRLFKVDFYDTAILLRGKDKKELLDAAERIFLSWRKYEDKANSIIPNDENGIHSTVTPLARKVDGEYFLYLILRNNRCDEHYPDGIFHVHPELFHIKKEGIGLIEAAGLFILPARLKRQCEQIEAAIKSNLDFASLVSQTPDLESFKPMYDEVKKGVSSRDYINSVCQQILCNVAVFKDTKEGQEGLDKFLRSCAL